GAHGISIIGMLWAVFFDWTDGILARQPGRKSKRSKVYQRLGAQLDSQIDIISFGVCPAVFLLSLGHGSIYYMPGASIFLATAALRLSYFSLSLSLS
ncbi:hypothetical protein KIPB_012778, partial [Kipferlia bialata]